MLPEWVQLLLGGGGLLAIAGLVTALANRKKGRAEVVQAAVDGARATVDGSRTLMEYVREEVKAAVALETADLRARITALETRQTSMRRIIRRAFENLIDWENKGHQGKMPLPSNSEMEELGIEDLTSTIAPDRTIDNEREAVL